VGGQYNSGILATGVSGKGIANYNYAPASAAIIERVAKIEAICDEYNVTLAAAALQFPLAHPSVVSVIPGLGNVSRILSGFGVIRFCIR
jgi:D-threo-aldose 1-dehydrogenase